MPPPAPPSGPLARDTAPIVPVPVLETLPTDSAAPPAAPLPVASEILAPVPATPPEDLTFGCVSDIRQLTLRAVLSTEQFLTAQNIIDRCAALPGLKACVLFRHDTTLVSSGMDEAAATAFRASAGKTRDSLASLAETMGLGSGGNFTLRTDLGVRSFFLESGLCLAVWHDQPVFSGGTREKLILIAHELAKT